MKKIILIVLLVFAMASCYKEVDGNIEPKPKRTTDINYLFVQNVNGCEYVFNINGGIWHDPETCPNPIHKQDMNSLAIGDTDDGI